MSSRPAALLALAVAIEGCASAPITPRAPTPDELMRRVEVWTPQHVDWLGRNCRYVGSEWTMVPHAAAGNVIEIVTDDTLWDGGPATNGVMVFHCATTPPWPRTDLDEVRADFAASMDSRSYRCTAVPAATRPSKVEVLDAGTGSDLGADSFVLFTARGISHLAGRFESPRHHGRSSLMAPKDAPREKAPEGTLLPYDEPAVERLVHASCLPNSCIQSGLQQAKKKGAKIRVTCEASTVELQVVDFGDASFVKAKLGI